MVFEIVTAWFTGWDLQTTFTKGRARLWSNFRYLHTFRLTITKIAEKNKELLDLAKPDQKVVL